MYYISKENTQKNNIDILSKQEQQYILDIGKRTWGFFEQYLTQDNNYLIPDNYQEDRKEKVVPRTSSTNIGLSLIAVISANDLGYIDYDKTKELIKNIVYTIQSLEKWNGHLYNWYNIKNKEPLFPRYVSTVDSGNFIGYLYVLKQWLENKEELQEITTIVKDIIENRRLTTEILNSILESTTRKIDLFDDVESRKILTFLKESNDVPVKVKVYIDDFLKKYKNSFNEEEEKENKFYPYMYVILGLLMIIIGIVSFFIGK